MKNWENQLNEVMLETEDDIFSDDEYKSFGVGVGWDIKRVHEYLTKIDDICFPACDINIPNYYTIEFELPEIDDKRAALLLFVLTSSPMPSFVKHKKRANKLVCKWEY